LSSKNNVKLSRKQPIDIVQEVDDEDDDDDDEEQESDDERKHRHEEKKVIPKNYSDSVRENVNVDYLSLFIHQREKNSIDMTYNTNNNAGATYDMNPIHQKNVVTTNTNDGKIDTSNHRNGNDHDRKQTMDVEDLSMMNLNVHVVKEKKRIMTSSSTFLAIRDIDYDGEEENDDTLSHIRKKSRKKREKKSNENKGYQGMKKKMTLSWSTTSSPSSSSDSDNEYEDLTNDKHGALLQHTNENSENNGVDPLSSSEQKVDNNKDINNDQTIHNNQSIHLFHERLDQLLTQKRLNGLEIALKDEPKKYFYQNQTTTTTTETERNDLVYIPIVKKFMSAFISTETGGHTDHDQNDNPKDHTNVNMGGKTIEERLHEIRSELRKNLQTTAQTKQGMDAYWDAKRARKGSSSSSSPINEQRKKKQLLFIGIICIIIFSFVTSWFAFGLYGMYVVFFVDRRNVLKSIAPEQQQQHPITEEMIVRLLQEIVLIKKRDNDDHHHNIVNSLTSCENDDDNTCLSNELN
jgi:hypothetical protein